MATIQKKTSKRVIKAVEKKKTDRTSKPIKKKSSGFEKAWEYWKTAQIDLSNSDIKSILAMRKSHGLNIYNSNQINAAGGIEAFSKLIGNDKPIEAPKILFTNEDWHEIERILKQD